MADLISRDDYREILDEQLRHYDDGTNPFHMQILKLQREILDDMPAVDAVPVVRCRDCEHFIDMSGTSYPSYCYKHTTFDVDGEFDIIFSVEPDTYCAWGERRNSE